MQECRGTHLALPSARGANLGVVRRGAAARLVISFSAIFQSALGRVLEIGYSRHDDDLSKLWISESRGCEVLCKLRHAIGRRLGAAPSDTARGHPGCARWTLSACAFVPAAATYPNFEYRREKYRHRMPDCCSDLSTAGAFVRTCLLARGTRQDVYTPAVLKNMRKTGAESAPFALSPSEAAGRPAPRSGRRGRGRFDGHHFLRPRIETRRDQLLM